MDSGPDLTRVFLRDTPFPLFLELVSVRFVLERVFLLKRLPNFSDFGEFAMVVMSTLGAPRSEYERWDWGTVFCLALLGSSAYVARTDPVSTAPGLLLLARYVPHLRFLFFSFLR